MTFLLDRQISLLSVAPEDKSSLFLDILFYWKRIKRVLTKPFLVQIISFNLVSLKPHCLHLYTSVFSDTLSSIISSPQQAHFIVYARSWKFGNINSGSWPKKRIESLYGYVSVVFSLLWVDICHPLAGSKITGLYFSNILDHLMRISLVFILSYWCAQKFFTIFSQTVLFHHF